MPSAITQDGISTSGSELVIKVNGSLEKVLNRSTEAVLNGSEKVLNGSMENKQPENNETERPPVSYAPSGSISSCKDIYQGPEDDDGRSTWVEKMPENIEEAAENEETAQYAVVVRKRKCYDSRKKFEVDSLVIQSPSLKLALAEVLKDYPDVVCSLDRLVFEAPFEPFVHRWGELLEFAKKKHDEKTTQDLDLLLGILKEELKDTIKAFEDFVTQGVIDWQNLWTVFQPGAILFSTVYGGIPVAVQFDRGHHIKTECGKAYSLECHNVSWDGSRFGMGMEKINIFEFRGVKHIKSLRAFPFAFHPDRESVIQRLTERGRVFESLAGAQYKAYNGLAIDRDNENNEIRVNVTGRIVVDAASWNKFSAHSTVYLDAIPHTELLPNGDAEDSDEETIGGIELGDFLTNGKKPHFRLKDEHLLICTPKLRGYSLKSKKWLEFFVHLVKEVEWNGDAFDSLVLPEEQKEMILAFVESQIHHRESFDDVIQGKGKGIIMLLAGPPGTGKTLSCESTAEAMKVPCYSLGAGELGDNAWDVERRLTSVLEMVQSWQAVLLIDECDVFLEARSTNDIARNALVSVFLRLLEYFEGILFLTTNRAENIDRAFQSRIHVSITYPELDRESRRRIWANFLLRSTQAHAVSEADLDDLAKVELNGRQIKNLLKTSQLLASRKKSELKRQHIDTVLAVEKRRIL